MRSRDTRRPGYLEGRHTPQFALRDLRKDLDFATTLLAQTGSVTPLTRSSSDLVTAAAAATPDLDISAVVQPYRETAPEPSADNLADSSAAAASR